MIYVLGGSRAGSVADMDEYDPVNDMWRPLPPLPRISDHLVAGVIDGKIYVAGGRSGGVGGHTDRLDIYDPATGWSEGPRMPTSRAGAMAAVFGDRLFVFGGEGDSTSQNGVFDEVEMFDVSASAWTPLAPMRTPRHGTGAATVGDRIYVPGGADVEAFSAVETVEVFVPPP
jgi:N-acetylneuraminic acid mutarotase